MPHTHCPGQIVSSADRYLRDLSLPLYTLAIAIPTKDYGNWGGEWVRRRDHLLLCLKETLSSGGIFPRCWISSEIIFLPAYTHLRLMGFSPFFCPSSTRPHSSGVPNNLKANVTSVSQFEYCSHQPWSPCKLQKQVNSQYTIKTNFSPSVVSPLIDVSVPQERQAVLSEIASYHLGGDQKGKRRERGTQTDRQKGKERQTERRAEEGKRRKD